MKTLLLVTIFMSMGILRISAQKDDAKYDTVDVNGVKYAIENLWLESSRISGVKFLPGTDSRGMAAKDGKMYFCDRDDNGNYVIVYNGLTGEKEKTVKLPDNVFTYGEGSPTEFPCNDIEFDRAGNLLVANMSTNLWKTPLQVWIVEIGEDEPVCTQVMSFSFEDLDPNKNAIRIDAFNVYGDMKNDGYVLAAIAGNIIGVSDKVLKFNIVGGVLVDEPEEISISSFFPIIDPKKPTPYNGTAPRVYPINENYFYLDGFFTYAALYDMDGIMSDGFDRVADVNNHPPKTGHNGVIEFTMMFGEKERKYVIMAWDNTEGATPTTWSIFELGPQGFEDMTKLFTFPKAGMGGESNAVRTAVPFVDVNEDEDEVTIYLYGYVNGAGAYKLTLKEGTPVPVSLSSLELNSVRITVDDETISLSESVHSLELYSLTGVRLASGQNTSSIAAPPVEGVYIVRVITMEGQSFTRKVLIK